MHTYMGNQVPNKNKPSQPSISQKKVINAIFQNYRKEHFKQSISIDIIETFKRVKGKLLRGFKASEQQHKQILDIIQYWNQFELQDLYNNTDVIGEDKLPFYQSYILTARILVKIKQFFKKVQWKKPFAHQCFKGVQIIGKYFDKEELQYNPGKQMLAKQEPRFSWSSYQHSKYANQYKQKVKINYIEKIFQIAKEQKIEFIVQFFIFLAKIDIIQLEGVKPLFENKFMKKLNNITKKQQREMFITSYSCKKLQQYLDLQKEQKIQELGNQLSQYLPNYFFYKNARRIRRKTMTLTQLHNKFEDYHFLQSVHDYIQWMFPNHYGSSFNSSSAALNYLQSEMFLQDHQVKTSVFYSIFIFTDFMGLKMDLQTLDFHIISQKRLRDVILVNYHNHLRIMRIFACLSVIGFRQIAKKLIQFLDHYTQKGQILQKQRHEFDKSWGIYGDQHIQEAKNMCFLQYDTFPDDNGFLTKFLSFAKISVAKQILQKPQENKIMTQNIKKEKQQKMEVEQSNQQNLFKQQKSNIQNFE